PWPAPRTRSAIGYPIRPSPTQPMFTPISPVVSSNCRHGRRGEEARPSGGPAQVNHRSDGHYSGRIHPRLTSVVVTLDVQQIDRLGDAGKLVDVLEPTPDVREVR